MASRIYSTYITSRASLVGNPEGRGSSSTTDQRFVNFYPEIISSPAGGDPMFNLRQRAGLQYYSKVTTGTGRGIYYYNGSLFYAVGNELYRNGSPFQTLSTSSGTVGFTEYSSDTTLYLFVVDGVTGYLIDKNNVVTTITASGFPTPHLPYPVFLDGYLFLVQAGTADVYNCDLDDPSSWQAGNFITAESYPDPITALVRQNNYVVAVGATTVEFFYDSGASPGTPLASNAGALQQVGTAAAGSVTQVETQVIFVGQSQTGGRSVWSLDNFTLSEISIEPVCQSLDDEGLNITSANAFCIRSMGHKFYVINLTSRTWVYDFNEQMWHEWANSIDQGVFNCNYATDHPTGSAFMLDDTTGIVYKFLDSISTDATSDTTSNNIISTAISARQDMSTYDRKFMNRLTIVGDSIAGQSCQLSWSDDDYRTYTSPRTINISDTMPTIAQLGAFRRRAFKLVYSGGIPWRVQGFEVDYNMGTR